MKLMRNYVGSWRMVCLVMLLVSGTLACSTEHEGETDHSQTLLIYMAGNSNLSSYAYANIESMTEGYVPKWCRPGKGDVLLVYLHTKDTLPRLLRLYRDNRNQVKQEVLREYDPHHSLDPAVMRQVLSFAAETYPAQENGLVLWSHGTGWLPKGYYDDPDAYEHLEYPHRTQQRYPSLDEDPMRDYVKAMGPDSGIEIDLQELAAALPVRYDYLIFDACLMAAVEVAYELREKTALMVASSAEILAQGFPYQSYIRPILSGPKADLESVARIYYDYYNEQSGYYRSATISLIRTDALEELADVVKPIFGTYRDEIRQLDRYSVQGFYRNQRDFFFDLEDFIARVATPQELDQLRQALDKVVLYKAATPAFLDGPSYGFDIRTHCGLTTYIPDPAKSYLNEYYRSLAWNQAVGLVIAEN